MKKQGKPRRNLDVSRSPDRRRAAGPSYVLLGDGRALRLPSPSAAWQPAS
jgi:hypothetical protein